MNQTTLTITLAVDDWTWLDNAIIEAIEGRHPSNYEYANDSDSKAVVRHYKELKKRLKKAMHDTNSAFDQVRRSA